MAPQDKITRPMIFTENSIATEALPLFGLPAPLHAIQHVRKAISSFSFLHRAFLLRSISILPAFHFLDPTSREVSSFLRNQPNKHTTSSILHGLRHLRPGMNSRKHPKRWKHLVSIIRILFAFISKSRPYSCHH